jgi:prepilin-type N-terminal cleavage/methylation domain-containing protein
MNRQKQAFTLVELIVVITILAILWTIAFISLQWYSTQARDSTRVSDLSSMKTSLELFHLDAGKYPQPTNGIDITYSWWVVWSQWIFWETVYANVEKLDKVPTDPLTDNFYTYSVTWIKNEYQLWWIIEWDEISMSYNWITKTNAWETIANAIVTGSYNWVITKSNSGTLCNILSLPSIITNDTTVTDLQQIVANNSFVYRWYKNLPSSFKNSKFKNDWWFAFTSNKLVSYSDTWSCNTLIDKTSYVSRVTLLKWLQDAYTWTIVKEVWEIKNILDLAINENSPSQEVIKYSDNFVNNNLWANVFVGSLPVNTSPYASCTAANQTSLASSTYTWCDTADKIVCSWNWAWYTIASCNVWSTIAWTSSTSYWEFFQWWRNKWFAFGDTSQQATTIAWSVWLNAWTDTYWFVRNWAWFLDYNWANTDNTDNWGHTTATNSARQWPCASWYHVPTQTEWSWITTAWWWWSNWTNMMSALSLPMWGYRHVNFNIHQNNGTYARFWSSTPTWNDWYYIDITTWTIAHNLIMFRGYGLTVRCFKN